MKEWRYMDNLKPVSDVGLITAFTILGLSPIDRKKDGRRIAYVYEWNDEMQQLEDDWFCNRGDMGKWRTFHTTMKSVKHAIFELERRLE
jgi:hypothetical protein